MYCKPLLKTIDAKEIKSVVTAGACSGYVCLDANLFTCAYASFNSGCSTYDPNKCDPLAAPTAGHGNYPAGNGSDSARI